MFVCCVCVCVCTYYVYLCVCACVHAYMHPCMSVRMQMLTEQQGLKNGGPEIFTIHNLSTGTER